MNCPSCSAPLPYDQRFAALVVCEHCYSAVVFDDAVAKLAGKMAVLSRPRSGLYVGATGRISNHLAFRCIGRVRYAYGRGFWDEWYLLHDDQSTSWLSEDEQELTHDRPKRHQLSQSQLQGIVPGAKLNIDGQDYHVMESDTAICEGGEGQLPFRIISGEGVPYFDLETPERAPATLEVEPDGSVKLFAGQTLGPFDLKLDAPAPKSSDDSFATPAPESRERVHYGSGEAVTIRCKHCGASNIDPKLGQGPLHCRQCGKTLLDEGPRFPCISCSATIQCSSPDAKSVHCPACGTAQSISQGKPTLLSTLAQTESYQEQRPRPLALGDKANFDDLNFMVVGYLCYAEIDEDNQVYRSDEYLLYNEQWGHRWLSCYETQWTLQCKLSEIPDITPDQLRYTDYHSKVVVNGKVWRFYESGTGHIEWIQGEFPWVAQVGDTSHYLELIDPPHMLVCELSDTEFEWSKFRYIDRDELAKAFDKAPFDFPSPIGVGACQPNTSKPFYNTARLVVFLFALASVGLGFARPGTLVQSLHFDRDIFGKEVFSQPFEVTNADLVHRIDFVSDVNNQWVSLDWALVSKDDKAMFESAVDISYYSGVDHEGRWTEGSHRESQYFKLPAGQYRILMTGIGGRSEVSDPSVKVPVTATIFADTWKTSHFIIFAVALFVLFLILSFAGALHESRRWSHTADDDDD